MRTPSLRRRAVLWSVGVLALLLLVVGVGVDLALGTVLRADQRDRVESVASLAASLTGLDDQELADRVSVPGVVAVITDDATGDEIVGVPRPPRDGPPPGRPSPTDGPGAPVTVVERDGGVSAVLQLRPGVSLVVSADNAPVQRALTSFRVVMAVASLAAMALAALLLPAVLRAAMRPLDALTRAARETAAGGRGRRLAPLDVDTDLGRAAAQFDAMLEELEGAERREAAAADRLARFLSDASHELRTPLAGASTAAERLIREDLDAAGRERIAVQLVREVRRAGRLVDDLLLVSRLGDVVLETRPHPLDAVLRDAAERATARGDGATTIDVDGSDALVEIDRGRIDQVLANLLRNATEAGAHRIRITAETGTEGREVVVRVADDGPGVPPADRERIFERLVRLDGHRADRGSGLGLPIARGLVEAHGGSLACVEPDADDPHGAVFVLRLPTAPADAAG